MGDSANPFDNSEAQGLVLIFVVYDIIDTASVQFTVKLSLQKQLWPQLQEKVLLNTQHVRKILQPAF